MDTYQAVYDATRSKISSCDTYDAINRAAANAFDPGIAWALIQQEFCIAASEHARPSAVYRPALTLDGTAWCALYGENLMDGVAGFGDTPEAAMRAFDEAWMKQRTPAAIRAARDVEQSARRNDDAAV